MANTYHADFPAPERARGQAIPIEHRANLAIRCGRPIIAPAVWANLSRKGREHRQTGARPFDAFMVDVQWTNGWVSEHDGRELEFAGGQR